jgi:ribosomal protein L13
VLAAEHHRDARGEAAERLARRVDHVPLARGLTGSKADKKVYIHHTLFPGGIKTRLAKDVLATDPERAIREAVWGMLPKGPLGRRIIKKLKIYRTAEHEHAAQQPRVLEIPIKYASKN